MTIGFFGALLEAPWLGGVVPGPTVLKGAALICALAKGTHQGSPGVPGRYILVEGMCLVYFGCSLHFFDLRYEMMSFLKCHLLS